VAIIIRSNVINCSDGCEKMNNTYNPSTGWHIFLVTAFLALATSALNAKTYFVSMAGDDTNIGTLTSPWRTLDFAEDQLSAGDTLLIRGGTYTGFKINDVNGTLDNYIVFMNYNSESVTIDRGSRSKTISMTNASYVELNGLTITDSNGASAPSTADGLKTNAGCDYVTVKNCTIYNIGGEGIALTTFNHHHQYINNTIYDVGLSKDGYGIYMKGHDHVFRNNVVHDAYGYGIHMYASAGSVSNNLIENNMIYNNGRDDFFDPGRMSSPRPVGDGIIAAGDNHIIRNNLVYNNRVWGIRVWATNTQLFNNTVYGSGFDGIKIKNNTCTVKNNISYKNAGIDGGVDLLLSGSTASHNLFSTDPRFVDENNGDFRLKSDSPAIDAAQPIATFNTDIEGKRRLDNSWDIGAYELESGTSDSTSKSPSATIQLNQNIPLNKGTVEVTLTTSSNVIQIPHQFMLTDSRGNIITIALSGTVPGTRFQGSFMVDAAMAEGQALFSLSANALVDEDGLTGHAITSGSTIVIDQSPALPKNFKIVPHE